MGFFIFFYYFLHLLLNSMKFLGSFFVLFFACLVSAQIGNPNEFERKFIIDPFTEVTPTILITTYYTLDRYDSSDDVSVARSVQGNSIFGGDRDVILTVTGGDSNLLLTAGVSGGAFSVSTPNEAIGRCEYYLDGGNDDDDSVASNLVFNRAGLRGLPDSNFELGNAVAIRILMESDLETRVTFAFHSPPNNDGSDNACTYFEDLPADDQLNEYFLLYERDPNELQVGENQNCDWREITGIQITIAMVDNRDVIVEDFSTWGPIETCQCTCPTFTCQLLFDYDEFTYYFTSQLGGGGVFNPTTDFSTIYVEPSVTSSPRAPGVSVTPQPSVDIDDDDDFFIFFFDDDDGRPSTNNNSPNDRDSSSGAESLAFMGIFALLLIALF